MNIEREELIRKVGLCFVSGMTAEVVRAMLDRSFPLEDFYTLDMQKLSDRLGLNPGCHRFEQLNRQEALFRARREVEFMEAHQIAAYTLFDDDYPLLLREIPDAPVTLFKVGRASLDGEHVLNLVGSRRPTSYGCDFCKSFVSDMHDYFSDLIVVSGLAYGIDSMAHQAALDNGLVTVAVVAHGLDVIYPAANRGLAASIVRSGGAIVSEYPTGTRPFPGNFLERNRIIAGLSHLTIVVESEVKGGAMNTANTANSYSRDVMAVPGRINDRMSAGTNLLIRRNKAHLLTAAADVIELLGWRPLGVHVDARQRNLFPELTGDNAMIYETLRRHAEPISIDSLHQLTRLAMPALMSALTEMEFDGMIVKLPGARYSIS